MKGKELKIQLLCRILIGVIILCSLYLAFGLVPTMCEVAVKQNWNGLGAENRWFYFFYFLTLGFITPAGILTTAH